MFLTSKSFVLLWLFMGRKMRKKYFQKHGKNISFCVSSKSSLFEVAILNLGLEGSNLKILRLGRAHMPRNIQNYWFLTKKHHVKKSVPQIYNSPRALALKVNDYLFYLRVLFQNVCAQNACKNKTKINDTIMQLLSLGKSGYTFPCLKGLVNFILSL